MRRETQDQNQSVHASSMTNEAVKGERQQSQDQPACAVDTSAAQAVSTSEGRVSAGNEVCLVNRSLALINHDANSLIAVVNSSVSSSGHSTTELTSKSDK